MFWWWLSTALSTIAVLIAVVSAVTSYRALAAARVRWSDSLAVHKIEMCRTELADLRDLYEHQSRLYKRLTARQRKRDAAADPQPPPQEEEAPPQNALPLAQGEPSPYTDPEGWKRWKRAKLAEARLRG